MEENSNLLLSISTFGNFVVKKGDKHLNQASKKSSKRWKLLSYLITHNERNVSREELIFKLNLNDNNDPQGSLSALVYRLRQILKTDQKNREYLKTCGSAYSFNLKTDYWFDFEELEKLLKSSKEKAADNLEKSYQLFNQAIKLYKGDYLEEFNSQEWIWNFRNKYKELMIKTLLELDQQFQQENEYSKLMQLYNKIQQRISFDERILKNSIEALINSGSLNQAKQKYNQLRSLYDDNDLILPTSIKRLERKLDDQQLKFSEDISPKQIEEDKNGAFICEDRSVFSDIYKLEKRRMERDKRPRCVSHIRLKSECGREKLKSYSEKLLGLLSDQLRAGDLICHWRVKHFNILLMDIKEKEAEKVIKRIKRYFNSKYNPKKQLDLIFKNYQLKSN